MSEIDVYSKLSFEEAVDADGKNIDHPRRWEFHQKMVPFLRIIAVKHVSFENPESERLVLRQGQLVVHRDLVDTFTELHKRWLELDFPIKHCVPISQAPNSDDNYAMAESFSHVYRPDVVGNIDDPNAPWSEHARGSAGDYNQLDNPLITADFHVQPPQAIGRLPRLGMVMLRDPEVMQAAKELGFELGVDWPDSRAGKGYYGIDSEGNPRHILRDSHHIEIIPSLAEQLPMPSFEVT